MSWFSNIRNKIKAIVSNATSGVRDSIITQINNAVSGIASRSTRGTQRYTGNRGNDELTEKYNNEAR